MECIRITDNNLEEFACLLSPDVAENIWREQYRGIALRETPSVPASAALVWKIKGNSVNDNDQVRSAEIVHVYGYFDGNEKDDERALANMKALLSQYHLEAAKDGVKKTFFSLPLSPAQQTLFTEEGFSIEARESRNLIVTVGELATLSLLQGEVHHSIQSLFHLPLRQYRRGIFNFLSQHRTGLNADLQSLPMRYFSPEVSACLVRNGNVSGFLLVHETASGLFRVEFLSAFPPDVSPQLLQLIRYSIRAAAEHYPPETKVILCRHNAASEKLVNKLFPDKKGEIVIFGEREE